MLAVQFGGSDNIWVDCRNHSATGESWRGVAVFRWNVCVYSQKESVFFVSPSSPRGWWEGGTGRLIFQTLLHIFHPIPLSVLDSMYSVPLILPGIRSVLSDVFVSSCLVAHSLRLVHTLTLTHTLHLVLCLQVSLWPQPCPVEGVIKKHIFSASPLTF